MLIDVVRDYVAHMVTNVNGMKVLVMDAETTGVVSMVYTQTQILQHEVFLIDAIEHERIDKMPHLKAVYFLRPTIENMRLLQQEFKDPKYGEYNLFFSNLTRDGQIQQLAEADEHEVVHQVQEFYADFLPLNRDLFSINVPSIVGLSSHDNGSWDQIVYDRIHQALCAVLLALKKRPVLRYQKKSELAMRVAESVLGTMDTEGELFSFRRAEVAPLLLLVDRADDPVTPLLNQWTYQAMIHELIGINNNRVDLRGRPGVPQELEQVVLAPEQDVFYADNMFLNYGELAQNVKTMMDQFQAKTKSSKQISSIADMQAFVESYPEFRKLSGDVTKHVTLLSELNRLVDVGALFEASEVEQELACTEDHSSAVSEVETLLGKPSLSIENKLRLVSLYALRYEKTSNNHVERFIERLAAVGASANQQRVVRLMISRYGMAQRAGDLFANKSWLAATKRSLQKGMKGVENVYTQHTPHLSQTLDAVIKATLSEVTFPYLGCDAPTDAKKRSPTDVIVFMLGGATFEEARMVAEMNVANPGVRVLLGGTKIHNAESFMEELSKMDGGTATGQSSSGQDAVSSGIAVLGMNAPKKMVALTSSVTSSVRVRRSQKPGSRQTVPTTIHSVHQGSNAISKLQ
jgi:vacuolar protein sorting-associated protein 45